MTQAARLAMTGEIALVTIDNPPVNTFSRHVRAALKTHFTALRGNPAVKAIVLACTGRTFVSGGDMREFETGILEPGYHEVLNLIEDSPVPVVAALHGTVMGAGVETAIACHFRIATEGTRLGLPELSLGIIPGAGGTQRLTRAVGKALAMEVMLGNRQLTAQEALTFGLVNKVAPLDSYLSEAVALAGKIAAMPRVAVRLIKDAVNKAEELSLTEGLDYEKRNFYLAFGTEDKTEGMSAFVEKRQPQWKHR